MSLPTQREALEVLGCYGSGKADKLAEIVAATVLAGETSLSGALFMGMFVASILFAFLAAGAVYLLKVDEIRPGGASYTGSWGVYFALVGGLVLGILIGKVTEYYTSERKRHAKAIARHLGQTLPLDAQGHVVLEPVDRVAGGVVRTCRIDDRVDVWR